MSDFENLLNIHLTRLLQYWKNKIGEDVPAGEDGSRIDSDEKYLEIDNQSDDSIELGLLDFVEISESRFEELESISSRIALCTVEIGEKMNLRTDEIQLAIEAAKGNLNRSSAIGLIAKASKDMEQYAARINAELPLFSRNLNEGMDALMQGVRISIEMDPTLVEQDALQENIEAVSNLQSVLEESKEAILTFRKSVHCLPRMTSILNAAKRKVISALDKLAREAEKLLRGAS